jgi:hypothetical protein
MIQFENAVSYFNKLILDDLKKNGVKTVWVAGGSIRDYFLAEISPKTDIDLFFPDSEQAELCKKALVKLGAKEVFSSGNSIRYRYKRRVFDVVHKYFRPTPQELINTFDFTVCQLATDGTSIFHAPTTFIDLAKKQLMFNQSQFPANCIWRLTKYLMKGFKVCVGEVQKVADCYAEWLLEEEKRKAEISSDSKEALSDDELKEEYGDNDKGSVRIGID